MTARRRVARSGLAAFLLLLVAAPAAVAEDDALGRFRDWYAATFVEDGARICYVVSQPVASEGDYTRRGPTYVQVTRHAGGGGDVVSIEAGYPYEPGSEVEAQIDDGDAHALFTDGETAWAYDDDGDRALVAAMAGGLGLVVRGTSQRGTRTTDRYSLLGFSAARAAAAEACGR